MYIFPVFIEINWEERTIEFKTQKDGILVAYIDVPKPDIAGCTMTIKTELYLPIYISR